LKKSDQALEQRVIEAKLEQQQLVTICNLMGPIINAFGGSNGEKRIPKTFIELITQLDEV